PAVKQCRATCRLSSKSDRHWQNGRMTKRPSNRPHQIANWGRTSIGAILYLNYGCVKAGRHEAPALSAAMSGRQAPADQFDKGKRGKNAQARGEEEHPARERSGVDAREQHADRAAKRRHRAPAEQEPAG